MREKKISCGMFKEFFFSGYKDKTGLKVIATRFNISTFKYISVYSIFLKVGHALIIQQWFNLGKAPIYPCRVDPGVCVSVCSEDTASWAGHSVTLACYCIGSTHTLAFSSVGITLYMRDLISVLWTFIYCVWFVWFNYSLFYDF